MSLAVIFIPGKDVERVANDIVMRADKLGKNTETALVSAANRVAGIMRANAPSMTGRLKASIGVKRVNQYEYRVGPQGMEGSRSSPLPRGYAFYVDSGNAAHWPNVTDIGSRYGVGNKESFLIARAISRKINFGSGFIKDTMPEAEAIFKQEIKKVFDMSWL